MSLQDTMGTGGGEDYNLFFNALPINTKLLHHFSGPMPDSLIVQKVLPQIWCSSLSNRQGHDLLEHN